MSASLRVSVAGESLSLLPPGAVWWERRKTLFAADLHFDAVPEPESETSAPGFDEDLERLLGLAREHRAERVVVLGDFFHGPDVISEAQLEHARAWRAALAMPVWLALGNHETDLVGEATSTPFDRIAQAFAEDPFLLTHKPAEKAAGMAQRGAHGGTGEAYRLCGHLHPVARLEEGRRKLQMRCFVREPHQLILPSFGRMTGGTPVEGAKGRARYPVTGDSVLDLGI